MNKKRTFFPDPSSYRQKSIAGVFAVGMLICAAITVHRAAAQVGRPLPCAADVSDQVQVSYDRTSQTDQKVVLQNISKEDLTGPLTLVLDELKAGVTLDNSDGVTRCEAPIGSPYINVDVGDDDEFTSGERAEVVLQFTDQSANIRPITYNTRVLAGFGLR